MHLGCPENKINSLAEARLPLLCRPGLIGAVLHRDIKPEPHEPARRIPVSQTGYRSHFAPMDDVEASASPQDHARDVALGMLQPGRKAAGDDNQLPLF